MITISFHEASFFFGIVIGVVVGAAVTLFLFMREDGGWSKGFDDGCNLRFLVNKIEKIVSNMEDKNESSQ